MSTNRALQRRKAQLEARNAKKMFKQALANGALAEQMIKKAVNSMPLKARLKVAVQIARGTWE